MACTRRRAPFRSRRWCCLSNRRLARNRFQARTQSDPCISSVATGKAKCDPARKSGENHRVSNVHVGTLLEAHLIAVLIRQGVLSQTLRPLKRMSRCERSPIIVSARLHCLGRWVAPTPNFGRNGFRFLRAGSSPLSWICGVIGITTRYPHLLCSHSLAVVNRMLA